VQSCRRSSRIVAYSALRFSVYLRRISWANWFLFLALLFWIGMISRSVLTKIMRVKSYLHLRSQRPWPLTFRPRIFSTSYTCPALFFTKLEVSMAFPFRGNWRYGADGRTGQRLMRLMGGGGREIRGQTTSKEKFRKKGILFDSF